MGTIILLENTWQGKLMKRSRNFRAVNKAMDVMFHELQKCDNKTIDDLRTDIYAFFQSIMALITSTRVIEEQEISGGDCA